MHLSNSRQSIFVHITKAAGTSVTEALDPTLCWNNIVLGGTGFGDQMEIGHKARFGLHKHSFSRDIQAVVGEEIWNDYFTFTFVRNPFALAVSVYTYTEKLLKARGFNRHLRRLPFKRYRSDEFWSWPVTKAILQSASFSEFIRNEHAREALGMRPQVDWTHDESGNSLVNFIGKVEVIGQDFDKVVDKIGLEAIELERLNQSSGKKWSAHFQAEEDFDYLHKFYEKDFEAYGYDPAVRE